MTLGFSSCSIQFLSLPLKLSGHSYQCRDDVWATFRATKRDVRSFNSAGFAWWFLTVDWGIRFSSATTSHFSRHKIGLADMKNGFWILFSRLAKETAYVCWPLWQHVKPLHLSWCLRKAKVKRWHRNGFHSGKISFVDGKADNVFLKTSIHLLFVLLLGSGLITLSKTTRP